MLRVKDQTLKSRLHRGRLILRKQLADFAGGLDAASRRGVNAGQAGRVGKRDREQRSQSSSPAPARCRARHPVRATHRILERHAVACAERRLDRDNAARSEPDGQRGGPVTTSARVVGRHEAVMVGATVRRALRSRPLRQRRQRVRPGGHRCATRPRSRRRAAASSTRVGGEAADRRFLPWNHHVRRAARRARSAPRRRRSVGLERHHGADRAGQRFRRGSEERMPSANPARARRARPARAARLPRRRRSAAPPSCRIRPSSSEPVLALHSPAPTRSASTNTMRRRRLTRRPARPTTRVAKRSIGAACMMSSALPAATWPVVVDETDALERRRAAPAVRERAAELAGADDGDLGHRSAIVASRGSIRPNVSLELEPGA